MGVVKENKVRISDLISGNFHEFWKTKKSKRVLKGGRSSLKSSAISLKLVNRKLEDDKSNIVCLRKVGKYLHGSVYGQISWAIHALGVEREFRFLKSPLEIRHKRTNTSFYFFGVDEPEKLKSAKIINGYVTDVWFEETAEFASAEEIDTVTISFIRELLPDGKEVGQYFSYNPPRNPYAWINEWIEEQEKDDDVYVHHSTYEEDTLGVLSPQFLREADKVKVINKDYWDYVYGGKVIGLGDVVYNINLFKLIKTMPTDDVLLMADVALDTGYSVSCTTFLFIGLTLKGNVILLDTYYYNPENQLNKKAPSDFAKELNEFTVRNRNQYKVNVDTEVIDSADAALRNQYNKDYHVLLQPAKKKLKVKMVENVEDLLSQGRVYVLDTPSNEIFISEHKKYQWDPKKKLTDKPEVIKVDDHTCDAFQYYVGNNLAKLGLKI